MGLCRAPGPVGQSPLPSRLAISICEDISQLDNALQTEEIYLVTARVSVITPLSILIRNSAQIFRPKYSPPEFRGGCRPDQDIHLYPCTSSLNEIRFDTWQHDLANARGR